MFFVGRKDSSKRSTICPNILQGTVNVSSSALKIPFGSSINPMMSRNSGRLLNCWYVTCFPLSSRKEYLEYVSEFLSSPEHSLWNKNPQIMNNRSGKRIQLTSTGHLVQVAIIEGWLSNLKPLKQSGCRTIPFKNLRCRVLQCPCTYQSTNLLRYSIRIPHEMGWTEYVHSPPVF